MKNSHKYILELLKHGIEDWIQAAEVVSIVKSNSEINDYEKLRKDTLVIIREVVEMKLMILGDVDESGFHSWDISVEKSLEKVEKEWDKLGRLPMLGELCWLSNTQLGDELVAYGEREELSN
jgi:biotin synthase-related radical SAM superfamily protein